MNRLKIHDPAPRMRVLCVLSSSNQMYSGIGRNVFETAAHLADRVDYTFAIDDRHEKNVRLVVEFGRKHGMTVHVGPGRTEGRALDVANDDLPDLIRGGGWDAIEAVSWANAATNNQILCTIGDGDDVLAYTPHHQPTWTVPMSPEQALFNEGVYHRMICRSDLVFCDSPWERVFLQSAARGRNNCRHIPLGCDFAHFLPGPPGREEQLVFVGDLVEPRKRFDRVVAVLQRLLPRRPGLKLIVIGNRDERVLNSIPEDVRAACDLRGYVDEPTLRRIYAESAGLILLSDYEAFGIPILEAMACATPVFLAEQEATRTLFGRFRGAHFAPGDDADLTADQIDQSLARGRDAIDEVLAERARLQALFNWEDLADQKWRALSAAWFAKHCWAWPA